MQLWRLTPATDEADPRWRGQKPLGELLVAARTPGEARVVASHALAGGDTTAVGNEIGPPTTAVNDPKLYRLDRLSARRRKLPETPQVLEIQR